jgi:hypothetical protein
MVGTIRSRNEVEAPPNESRSDARTPGTCRGLTSLIGQVGGVGERPLARQVMPLYEVRAALFAQIED